MKIPLFLKQKYPIIEDSKGCIIWIPGIYLNRKYCTNNKEGKKFYGWSKTKKINFKKRVAK